MSSALSRALEEQDPACAGDDAFTADELAPAERARLAVVCRRCPVRAECDADARANRPLWGFWAGRQYGKPLLPGAGRTPAPEAAPPAPAPRVVEPIAVGQEFVNVRDNPGRRVVVSEIVDGDNGGEPSVRYTILNAGKSTTRGSQVGDRQWCVASALNASARYRRV